MLTVVVLFYELEKVCLHFSGCHGFRHILAYIVYWYFEFLHLVRFQLVHDFDYSVIVKFTFFKSDTHTQSFVEQNGNNNAINYYNIARGGQTASWGAAKLKERVEEMNKHYGSTIIPDLIYIKFAGNDSATTPESFKASMTSMVNQFRELYPEASIVLISGKINNERSRRVYGKFHDNLFALERVLESIADVTENCNGTHYGFLRRKRG